MIQGWDARDIESKCLGKNRSFLQAGTRQSLSRRFRATCTFDIQCRGICARRLCTESAHCHIWELPLRAPSFSI